MSQQGNTEISQSYKYKNKNLLAINGLNQFAQHTYKF